MLRISFRSDWAIALYVAVCWQILMTFVGIVLERRYSIHPHSTMTPLSHMAYWDGGWYTTIISGDGYKLNGAAPVFYPLLPAAVVSLQILSGHLLSVTAAALLINTAALWLAIVALLRISKIFLKPERAWWVVALFLLSPAAIFMHFLYVEALFCALAFWAYLFALQKKWLFMAITLALLSAAKLPAILIIGLCALEFMRAYQWSIKKICNWNILYFALTPLGFLIYGLYLKHIKGDFMAMFHGYHETHDWDYHVFNPNFVEPLLRAAHKSALLALGRIPNHSFVLVDYTLPLIGLGLLGLSSLLAIFWFRGKAIPLGIAGLVSIVFFGINSNIISVHRYLLPSVILYLMPFMIIDKLKKPRLIWAVYAALVVGVGLQALLYYFFVSSRFAG